MYSMISSSNSNSSSFSTNGFHNNYGAIISDTSLVPDDKEVTFNKNGGGNCNSSSFKKRLMIFFGIFLTILIGIYCFYGGFNEFTSLFMVNGDGTSTAGGNNHGSINSKNYYESMKFLGGMRSSNNNNKVVSSSGSSSSINANPVSPVVINKISQFYGSKLMSHAGGNSNSNLNSKNEHAIAKDAINCDLVHKKLGDSINKQISNSNGHYKKDYSNKYLISVDKANGRLGYLWSDELTGLTTALYRYNNNECDNNNNGNNNNNNKLNHFYSTNHLENYELVSNYGKSNLESISGFIMTQSCPSFNTALYEYYSESTCNYYYTINKNEISRSIYHAKNNNYKYQRTVGYVYVA